MFPKIFCEDDSDIEVFDTSNSLISFYPLFEYVFLDGMSRCF